MKLRRIACLLMALAMTLSGLALADSETDDLSARVEELEQQLAEAQALAELYYPYYERQVVAEFDGGVIMVDDVMPEYSYYESMYAQSGMTIAGTSYETQMKQDILDAAVEDAILLKNAIELGVELTEDELAKVEEDVESTLQYYIANYGSYLAAEGSTEEETRQAVVDFLEENGYGPDSLYSDCYNNAMLNAAYNWIIRSVEVTDDDVRAAYADKLAEDEESYSTSSYRFEGAMNRRETIAWKPAGYRAVKQILIGFDDDQTTRYNDLNDRISALTTELAVAQGEDAPEDARDPETIEAELDAAEADLDALYEELMPTVEEVISRFEAGEDFEALMEEYTADTALLREPLRSTGYYVHKDYAPWIEAGLPNVSVWDVPFREAASSIENIGEISEPARGKYGIYIVYYMADVPAGAVPIEEIYDALRESIYSSLASQTYQDTVSEWIENANVVYHLDRFQ